MERICTRCIMDTSDASITFDEAGHCNYCVDALARLPGEYFPNEQGKGMLDRCMEEIHDKGRGNAFDCMVGISGGLDSAYVLYLGHQYGLRMLCIHIDDGLDTQKAKENIARLCSKAATEVITVKPPIEQYKDVTKALFLAGVPHLALAQDNLLHAALREAAKKYRQWVALSGQNFAMECILQRGQDTINAGDKKHILALHKRFGVLPIPDLRFSTMFDAYIVSRYFSRTRTLRPLNYIDYRLDRTLEDMKDFCGFEYYGGKHYESVLTRFLQCYWLPQKFNFDKRKSHYSSLIVTGQLIREEAMELLKLPPYTSDALMQDDFRFLADYFGMSYEQFTQLVRQPSHRHTDYPVSLLNALAPLARKFRKYLG